MSWYTTARQWLEELSAIVVPRPGYVAEYSEAVNEIKHEIELMEKSETDLITDSLRIRYYAARRIWPIRNDRPPKVCDDYRTWGEWFAVMFHTSLEDFIQRAKDGNLRRRIMEHEIAKYGKSPLEPKPVEEKAA